MPEPKQQLDRGSLDRQYRSEYLKWVASLSPADRATLKELDLDRPQAERTSFAYLRAETFRDSPGMIGIAMDDHGTGLHPGLPVPDDDEAEPIDEDDLDRLKCYDAEILKTLLRVLIFPDRGRAGNLRSAFARLVALASALHIHGIGERSLESLASEIGCTRALLSFYVVQLRDFGGLDCHGGKSLKARETYATAQLWRTRPKRKKGEVPGADSEKITEGAL